MAKFRELTLDELKSLDKEFINFLVLNGIPGDDWVKLKENDPEKALKICSSFSDVVFTKILKNCCYVERHTPKHVVSIFCDDSKMFMLGIEAPKEANIDFTDSEQFKNLTTNLPEGLKKISSEKIYTQEREVEIWKMLNTGFFISDPKLYMALVDL